MTSTESEAGAADVICCASCGATENEDIKLTKCTSCELVQYCSVKCQQEHLPKHEQACKKRVGEIREEILFKQPESSHFGDCPICLLPLSLDPNQSSSYSCCSKIVCNGCSHANRLREKEQSLDQRARSAGIGCQKQRQKPTRTQ
jgi:hypothetical protein